jgi:signal transduction histidine kinase
MRRYFGTTLGQILAIVACSSVATFLLFIAMLFYPGGPPNPRWPWPITYRIAGLVEVLQGIPASEFDSVVQAAQGPALVARLNHAPVRCPGSTLNTRDLESALRAELPHISGVTARSCKADGQNPDIQVLVPLGHEILEIHTNRIGREPPRISFPFFGSLLFLCVGVATLSAWAVSRVIRPLRRLSERAEAFGRDIALAPIEEEGPMEIRRAAHAFNLMQERITASIQNRTRTLAAISHDLRTPLTRMRLQLETDRKEIARDKLLRDIGLMQTMVTSALTFLSSGSVAEKEEWLDVGALLATLCDEYEDSGARIHYDGPDRIPFLCRPDAIQRVMTNLIENAISFGGLVAVIASVRGKHIMIDVSDDGPGIPEDRLKDVIEPFVRLDPARAGRPGSVGLGLSIVNDIVRAHGGTLTLFNRQPSGLTARIEFS